MTQLLLRLFIRNYRNADSPAVRTAVGKMAGIVGILCNILLATGKLVAGLLAGSTAIVADAVNNLLDASSSVVTLLGFRMAQRPADKSHPYGHARYEYLAGLLVAALILISGGDQARSAVIKIIHPASTNLTVFTFLILVLSIAVKLWMCLFYRSLGLRIQSATLHAASVDSRNDVIASASVLLGCGAEYFFSIRIDGFVALAVALFILYSGFKQITETVSPLLGKQADDALIENITQLVLSHEQVLGIHDLLVHDYGPGQCYASVHAEISAHTDPIAAHDIIDHIEKEMLTQMNIHLVIHFDPVITQDA